MTDDLKKATTDERSRTHSLIRSLTDLMCGAQATNQRLRSKIDRFQTLEMCAPPDGVAEKRLYIVYNERRRESTVIQRIINVGENYYPDGTQASIFGYEAQFI